MKRKLAVLASILLLGVGLDQATKVLVVQDLPLGGQIPLIPGLFNLVHVRNRGAAFGLLGGMSHDFTRIFFTITTTLIIILVAYLWWRTPAGHWRAATGYGLILAGAAGNLIDRLRLGEVIDFLDVYYGPYHWPAFNVADSLVCLGAAFLVWVIFQEETDTHVSRTA
jgi:signal peptidase II